MRVFKPLFLGSTLLLLTACHTPASQLAPLGQESFKDYQSQTQEFVAQHRHFVTDDRQQELINNTPAEFVPEHPNGDAILLVHGLGDSPWTFRDLGQALAKQGYLVRTVLLPGHGTKPADMMGATSEQWDKAVQEQADILKKKYRKVFLGGFSTGCNLVLSYAYQHPDIAGLILFSPAFDVKTKLLSLAPVVGLFTDWLRAPDKKTEGVTPFKYATVPVRGLSAFKDTMDNAEKSLESGTYDKPVFVVMTQHDSIVKTKELIGELPKKFTNPNSKFVWYGSDDPEVKDSRVIVKTDSIPEKRISSFAHMSMTFSPDNEWYGENGKYRMCRNSMSDEDRKKCLTEKEVWYSAWGAAPKGKITARLTFNPYFDWQLKELVDVLKSADGGNGTNQTDKQTDKH